MARRTTTATNWGAALAAWAACAAWATACTAGNQAGNAGTDLAASTGGDSATIAQGDGSAGTDGAASTGLDADAARAAETVDGAPVSDSADVPAEVPVDPDASGAAEADSAFETAPTDSDPDLPTADGAGDQDAEPTLDAVQDQQADDAVADAEVSVAIDATASAGDSAGDTDDLGSSEVTTGCTATADCTPLEDGDLCNGTLYCDPVSKACKVNPASVVQCDGSEDTACAKAVCNPATGKCTGKAMADGTPCEDGLKCTVGDICGSGACVGGTDTCLCTKDADCIDQDDGNLCNGLLFCNKASKKCEFNPATVVNCPSVDDTTCSKNLCDAKTGKCAMTAVAEGKPCDDGNLCTPNEACTAGQCKAAQNVCQCENNADCAKAEDGNLCNGTLFCNNKVFPYQCAVNPTSVVVCPTVDDTACTKATCQPKTGTCAPVALPDSATCDADGNHCTPKDHCKQGKCEADANICQCQTTADCTAKDDADVCNGKLYCDKTKNVCKVNPATVVLCGASFDTPCIENRCDKKTGVCGMVALNDNGPCDADGNPCTVADTCASGKCVAASNTCECTADADCAAKEDGNPCNGTLYCDKATFKCTVNPKTVPTCPSVGDLACSKNLCNPKTAKCEMTPVLQGKPCDADGNTCTLYDTCDQGTCKLATNLCDCEIDGHCGELEDGKVCNGTLYCDKGTALHKCEVFGKSVVSCPLPTDGTCTMSVCDEKAAGCVAMPHNEGKECADGNLCTTGDLCKAGACGGAATLCDDKDACTQDACNTATGKCEFKAKICVDGNSCTQDSCDAKGECAFAPVGNGSPCSTADACADTASCQAGVCKPVPKTCDDKNPCTKDSCDPAKGCVTQAAPLTCDDGNPCTANDKCDELGKCAGVASACDDKDPCTVDKCDQGKGCVALAVPNCGKVATLPFADAFDCGKGTIWELQSKTTSPAWAIDASPAAPGYKSPLCSLNFNNGSDFSCPGGTSTLSGTAATPWFDATGVPGSAGLHVKFQYGGAWEGSPYDVLRVEGTTDDQDWKVVAELPSVGPSFVAKELDLKSYAGALFRLRAKFYTTDCSYNSTSGPFIDDFFVGTNACFADGDCNDSKPCTVDTCDKAAGKCTNKITDVPNGCSDGNVCTADACNLTTGGCSFTPSDGKACDDNKLCTVNDFCQGGVCGGKAKCDDGNLCTDDPCDGATGACSTLPKACDDKNPCTTDSCNTSTGACVFSPKSGGCDDGNDCTHQDACASGACTGKPLCDDNKPCTADSCKAGACTFKVKACDDSNPCTADSCEASTGNCVNTADDSLKPGGTCSQPAECQSAIPSCVAGKSVCGGGAVDPDKVNSPCKAGAGLCLAGGCDSRPSVLSALFAGPYVGGQSATLTVIVADADNDAAKSVSDIAGATADLTSVGGSNAVKLAFASAATVQQTWTLPVTTTALAAGSYVVPVTFTDKSGLSVSGHAVLIIHAGAVLSVGANETYKTIKAALDAAQSGDTVLITAGTYTGTGNKNLTMPAKNVFVVAPAGPDKVVVDCAGTGRFVAVNDVGKLDQLVLSGLTIKNCGAGAVRIVSTSAPAEMTLHNLNLLDNSNGDHGGGVHVSGSQAKVRVVGSLLKGNIVTGFGGGGAYLNKGSLTVLGSTLSDNKAVYSGVQYSGQGAGILVVAGKLVVRDTVLSANIGQQFNGQAIAAVGSTLEWTRLLVSGSDTPLYADGCGNVDVDRVTVIGGFKPMQVVNTIGDISVKDSLFAGGSDNVQLNGSNKLTVSDTRFIGGTGRALTVTSKATLSGLEVRNANAGTTNDRPVFLGCNGNGTITLKDSKFRKNISKSYGAVLLSNCEFEVDNCEFADNVTGLWGGAAYVSGTGSIRNSKFTNNYCVDGGGGGLTILPIPYQPKAFVLENVLLANNKAGNEGGGVHVTTTDPTATQPIVLRGLTFAGNTAKIGGGIAIAGNNVTLEHSILFGNTDTSTGGNSGDQFYAFATATNKPVVKWTLCDGAEDQFGDPGLKVNGGNGFFPGSDGNLDGDPLFTNGPKGGWYLAQVAAGQSKTSPAVDPKGGAPASGFSWGARTTRTDGAADGGALDFGWHW